MNVFSQLHIASLWSQAIYNDSSKGLTNLSHAVKNTTPQKSSFQNMDTKSDGSSEQLGSPQKLNSQQYQAMVQELVNKRKKILNPMLAMFFHEAPLKVKYARGTSIFEENGKRNLDCINNVSCIGHCHPEYVKRMTNQLNVLLTNSRFLYPILTQATEKLLAKFPPQLCVVTFVNTGSQANDLALQLARYHTKKRKVICLDHAYHGITQATMDISPYKWSSKYKKPDHVTVANCPDTYRGFLKNSQDPVKDYAEYFKTIIDEETGAFICQFMQSCGGQIIPPKNTYKEVYKVLRERGVVCIGDQVQTGFGRMGSNFWAFDYYGVIPDIVVMGKPMANGFPMSAVICTRQIANSMKQMGMSFFSTFGGNPMAATGLNAVLDVIQNQKLQENALKVGTYLRDSLKKMIPKYSFVGDVRGQGLFIGIDVVLSKETREQNPQTAKKVLQMMRAEGVLLSRDGPKENIIKMKPPIVFSMENANEVLEKLEKCFDNLENEAK